MRNSLQTITRLANNNKNNWLSGDIETNFLINLKQKKK